MSNQGEVRDQLVLEARRLADERSYGRVAELLGSQPDELLIDEPVLGFLLAEARHRLGDAAAAVELLLRVLPRLRRKGNDAWYREALNLEGILHFGMGDVARAEAAWARLLEAAGRAGDEAMTARVNNNFGVVYTLRGEPERALVSYGRATAACQRLGYFRGLAQAHVNLGITYREIDFHAEADQHFETAIDYARRDGSADEEGRATVERALLLGYRRDLGVGRASGERALELWRRLHDRTGEGEALRVLAIIACVDGRWEDGGAQAKEALAVAVETSSALLEAEVVELLARLSERQGDEEGATRHRERAEGLFAAMGAGAWGARLRRRLESLTA